MTLWYQFKCYQNKDFQKLHSSEMYNMMETSQCVGMTIPQIYLECYKKVILKLLKSKLL